MFGKKSNGSLGRYRNYSSSESYQPVRSPYRRRSVPVLPVLSFISGAAVCVLIIFLVRSCSCDNRSSENTQQRTETRTHTAPVDAEKNKLPHKKAVQYNQNTAIQAPAAAASDAKSVQEQPVEPFVPKKIDLGTHVEIITSPKK
jgi:hypothetical protein